MRNLKTLDRSIPGSSAHVQEYFGPWTGKVLSIIMFEGAAMSRRLFMRQIREILRCHFAHGLSREAIARSVGLSKGSVTNILHRFQSSGLGWPVDSALSDAELEACLYPPVERNPTVPCPDVQVIEGELRRPHVTMQLLWREYTATHPDGMSRASFYRYYRAHRIVEPTMVMVHKAGDKLFVDYSGDGLAYVNQQTGEIISVELFVCCLGGSSYCYAEGSPSQCANVINPKLYERKIPVI